MKKTKILLLEDDPIMLSLLTTLLSMDGYDVVTLDEKSHDLLHRIGQERPDVMLLDVHLASKNGLDLLRELRQTPSMKDLIVIMSSGMNVEPECMAAGANSFLLKPYMPDELLALIRKNLVLPLS